MRWGYSLRPAAVGLHEVADVSECGTAAGSACFVRIDRGEVRFDGESKFRTRDLLPSMISIESEDTEDAAPLWKNAITPGTNGEPTRKAEMSRIPEEFKTDS